MASWEVHGHATRAARGGIHVGSRDHWSIGYRFLVEWAGLTMELRGPLRGGHGRDSWVIMRLSARRQGVVCAWVVGVSLSVSACL